MMKNKFYFEHDGYEFYAELPFKPEVGDMLLIKGKQQGKEDVTFQVYCAPEQLVFDSIRGYWTIKPGLYQFHKEMVEKREAEKRSDPLDVI